MPVHPHERLVLRLLRYLRWSPIQCTPLLTEECRAPSVRINQSESLRGERASILEANAKMY